MLPFEKRANPILTECYPSPAFVPFAGLWSIYEKVSTV